MNIPDKVKVGGIEYRINITDVLKKCEKIFSELIRGNGISNEAKTG